MAKRNNKPAVSGYPLLFGYLGIFLIMIGGVLLLPILTLIFVPQDYIYLPCFIIPGGITIIIGVLLTLLLLGKEKGKLQKNQEMVLLNLVWVFAFIIGAIPFLFYEHTNFSKAFFESVSGFTSTGLTVFNPERLPSIFNLYRSIMLLFGGIGLVLVLTSAISARHGQLIYQAEGHNNQFLPNLIKGARTILGVYFYLTFIGTLLFIIFGMSPFDAINHSMACISNGGFSTKADNITNYNSISIEVVAIILMLLGSTSFFIFIQILRGDFKRIFKNTELIFSLISFITMFSIMLLVMVVNTSYAKEDCLRDGIFQYVSAQTTSGAQNITNLNSLPVFVLYILMINMITGGQIGSAGGGVKQYRIIYILKGINYYIQKAHKGEHIYQTKFINILGQKVLYDEQEFMKHLMFFLIYMTTIFIGTAIIVACGYQFLDASFEFISAIGTAGLSLGLTSKAAATNHFVLWVLMAGMYLGRLEIMPVIFGFRRAIYDTFHRKHKKVIFND